MNSIPPPVSSSTDSPILERRRVTFRNPSNATLSTGVTSGSAWRVPSLPGSASRAIILPSPSTSPFISTNGRVGVPSNLGILGPAATRSSLNGPSSTSSEGNNFNGGGGASGGASTRYNPPPPSTMASSTTRITRRSVNNPPSTTPKSTVSRTLVESVDENTFVAVVEGSGQARGEVGMACMNLRTSNLILCQFADTQSYHRVISKLNIFRPHQILMPSTCCERTGTPSQLFTQLRAEVSNVEIVPMLRRGFSEGRGLQRIKHLVVDKFSTVVQVVTQKYYCLAAAAALLKYIELVQAIIFSPKSMKVEFQGSDNTCMIDSKTAQNLELLHNTHRPVSSHSVHGILSNCRTPGGARLLRMHILQPPCDLKLIQQRLDCVDELIESREVLCGLEDILARIPLDIEHVISTLIQIPKSDSWKITEQRINFVIALKHILELLPVLMTTLENTTNEFFQTIRDELRAPVFDAILERIKRVLTDEVQLQKGLVNMRRQRCFAVKGGINPILDISRTAFCEIVEDMNQHVAELSNKHNLALRLGENAKRSYYMQLILPGKGDRMPHLPSIFLQVKKYRNVINFTTEGLLNLDHRCNEVRKEIEKISSIIVGDLVSEIREDISSIYTISEAAAQLDVLYALCKYAVTTLRCVRPRFSKLATAITNGRHPVLELVKNDIAVPNNTFLSEDSNFALITGPNMSGKTTYLKQVATLQILAQIGSFVPAESATFRIASNIFSRLGTGDKIEDNASSFAMEMTEMKYILDNINDNSLVIIDELGRGTSVEEGTGISFAMAEWLLRTKSFILFATHYLFLTRLETMYLNVVNYTLETQEWRLKPGTDRDDQQAPEGEVAGGEDASLSNCKLKYTHVLKRGVTEVEFYGLKLASLTSYPKEIVNHALSIAETIVENRRNPGGDGNQEEIQRNKNLHLLGSHLKLLAEMSDSVPKEELKDYLINLQQEFATTFGMRRIVTATEDNEEDDATQISSSADSVSEANLSLSHPDANSEANLTSNNRDADIRDEDAEINEIDEGAAITEEDVEEE